VNAINDSLKKKKLLVPARQLPGSPLSSPIHVHCCRCAAFCGVHPPHTHHGSSDFPISFIHCCFVRHHVYKPFYHPCGPSHMRGRFGVHRVDARRRRDVWSERSRAHLHLYLRSLVHSLIAGDALMSSDPHQYPRSRHHLRFQDFLDLGAWGPGLSTSRLESLLPYTIYLGLEPARAFPESLVGLEASARVGPARAQA